jgi:hypothetical protein
MDTTMKMEKMILGAVCAMIMGGISAVANCGSCEKHDKMDGDAKACEMKMCEKCTTMVTEADADKNGTLNAVEFETLHAKCMEMCKADVKEGEEAKELPSAADMFAKSDVDANGELTVSELAKSCSECGMVCPDCKAMNAEACAKACEGTEGCSDKKDMDASGSCEAPAPETK